jgi:hypothetical protein
MPKYTIASEEGAQRYGAEVGAEVELRLDENEERAVVAAGWIDHEKKQKEAK